MADWRPLKIKSILQIAIISHLNIVIEEKGKLIMLLMSIGGNLLFSTPSPKSKAIDWSKYNRLSV